MRLPCFKTYDVRGRVPEELNPELAYRIGQAIAEMLAPMRVAVGRDMRLSGPELASALIDGLRSRGVAVLDLGLCGTEMVYFATFSRSLDAGAMITASHNPAEYNGLKLVAGEALPLSAEQFTRLEQLARQSMPARSLRGELQTLDTTDEYLEHLSTLVPPSEVGSWKVVCDAGNGAIGPLLKRLAAVYPGLDLSLLHETPDGTFPRGVPNPLLPENRDTTSKAVVAAGADLGVAWDGDFDRCFLFDHRGQFVDNYYLLGALAASFVAPYPAAAVLYDPRLTWHTIEAVRAAGGTPLLCRTGHVFFKRMMRETGAVYGAEMSGHHYFHDFGCCDSGVLPWLCSLRMLGAGRVQEDARQRCALAELLDEGRRRAPISGEINRQVAEPEAALAAVRRLYERDCSNCIELDGISMEFPRWRFNLRSSNTEPLVRLNVESRGNPELVQEQTERILAVLDEYAAARL